MTPDSTSPVLTAEGRGCQPPERLDAPVQVWAPCRVRGPDGRVCQPPERLDAPVRVWAHCRVRGPDGRVCQPPVGQDDLGDSEIITNRLGRGIFLPRPYALPPIDSTVIIPMKTLTRTVPCIFFLTLLVGCASSSHVTARQEYKGAKIARPDHILVYDFAATAADVPPGSAVTGQYTRNMPQTPEQIAAGRKAGAQIAQVLTDEIRKMGLPAEQATQSTQPQIGDLVIRGYILSIDEGDAAKRVAVGFGSGASHLKTAVEGFLMTEKGLKKLGSGIDESGGSKSPGTAMALAGAVATHNPAGLIISTAMKAHAEASGSSKVEGRAEDTAKEIAKELQKKFKEQGWI